MQLWTTKWWSFGECQHAHATVQPSRSYMLTVPCSGRFRMPNMCRRDSADAEAQHTVERSGHHSGCITWAGATTRASPTRSFWRSARRCTGSSHSPVTRVTTSRFSASFRTSEEGPGLLRGPRCPRPRMPPLRHRPRPCYHHRHHRQHQQYSLEKRQRRCWRSHRCGRAGSRAYATARKPVFA
jgi:hypothetical protein